MINLPIKRSSPPIIILINVQIIEQSIVNKFDQQKHILVQEKGQGISLVIKNKSRLTKLFELVQNIRKENEINEQEKDIGCPKVYLVCYSSKPLEVLYERFTKVGQEIASKLIYFNLSPHQHSTIRPNRAFFGLDAKHQVQTITYGEGYSQMKPKQQLRLALRCAFDLHQQSQRFLIIETEKGLKDEEKELKKKGYKHYWTLQNFDKDQNGAQSLEACVKKISEEQSLKRKNNQQNNQPKTYEQSFYLSSLKQKLKPQQFQQITSNITFDHFHPSNILSPHNKIIEFLTKPKKSYTPTPKSSIRSPGSRQICSLVFKNMGDHKLYISKSSTSKDIGGLYYEELVQNRCFMSMMAGLIEEGNDDGGLHSLGLERSYGMIKESLIKSYETKKACMIVKPYLEGLVCLEKYADQFLQLIRMEDSPIKGLGSLIFWSVVANQSFRTKTLLQQLTLITVDKDQKDNLNDKKVKYLTKNSKSLKQFISQAQMNKASLLRVDYFWPFSTSQQPTSLSLDNDQHLIFHLSRQNSISFNDLNTNVLQEILILATLVAGDIEFSQQNKQSIGGRLITGLACHFRWEFDRSQIVDSLLVRAQKLKQHVQKILSGRKKKGQQTFNPLSYSNLQSKLIQHIRQNNPLQLLLLLPQDYARFIKPHQQQSVFSQFSPAKSSQQLQNRYVQAIVQRSLSFQIYGNCPPLYTLPNWIRSLGPKYRFIEYISMLTHSKDDFLLISKRMKIMATNQKHNALMIVDHCQLNEEIMDEAKNVRTIFISRFKKGQHEMPVIFEEEQQGKQLSYLQDSNDQLVGLLMDVYSKYVEKDKLNPYLFGKYKFVLETYIRIKCQQYNLNQQAAMTFCFELHKNISQGKNRYKEIQQKYKQNDKWKLLNTLPMEKNNQKITFIKNLHSFIEVWRLVDMITAEGENIKQMNEEERRIKKLPKINPKSLQSLKEWQNFIQPTIKSNIIQTLLSFIHPLTFIPATKYFQTQQEVDKFLVILQILQTLLKRYKNASTPINVSVNEENYVVEWQRLYYSLFPEQQVLCHYPKQFVKNAIAYLGNSQKDPWYLIHTSQKLALYRHSVEEGCCKKVFQLQGPWEMANSKVQKIEQSIQAVKVSTQKQYQLTFPLIDAETHQFKLISENLSTNGQTASKSEQTKQQQEKTDIVSIDFILHQDKDQIILKLKQTLPNQKTIQTSPKKLSLTRTQFLQNERILDFELLDLSEKNRSHNQSDKKELIILFVTNIGIYSSPIIVYVEQSVGVRSVEISLKHFGEQNQVSLTKIISLNEIEHPSQYQQTQTQHRDQFMSLSMYNQLLKSDSIQIKQTLHDQVKPTQTLRRTFIFEIAYYKQACINIWSNTNKKQLKQFNKQSPIIQILNFCPNEKQNTKSSTIVALFINTTVNQVTNGKLTKQNSINTNIQSIPSLLLLPLCQGGLLRQKLVCEQIKATNNSSYQVIPLFGGCFLQEKHEDSLKVSGFSYIHEISLNCVKNETCMIIKGVVYYSLREDEKLKQFNISDCPKILNTRTFQIQSPFANSILQNSIKYTKPQLHIFQSLTSQIETLPILSLTSSSVQPSLILTIEDNNISNHQQQEGGNQTTTIENNHKKKISNDDSYVRVWKINVQ